MNKCYKTVSHTHCHDNLLVQCRQKTSSKHQTFMTKLEQVLQVLDTTKLEKCYKTQFPKSYKRKMNTRQN